MRLSLALVISAPLFTINAWADEVCHYAGTTDYSGRLDVVTNVTSSAKDGSVTVDVVTRFTGKPILFTRVTYLMEEISTWTLGQLQSVAVNSRYLVYDHIVRQQWDEFERNGNSLNAYRLQGKSLDDFRLKYPEFVAHWDPATFGQPWLQDYRLAHPERRADLDLPPTDAQPDIRSPLALAFYWSRQIPRGGETATIFLPGFKKDKRVDLAITAAEPQSDGSQPWQTSVRYPALNPNRPSTAKAWIARDGHLLKLAFNVQSRGRSGEGVLQLEGCNGTLVARSK